MKTNAIIQGDALSVLKTLPEKSINMLMTSPPYWALRDYGSDVESIWDGEENCEHEWGREIEASGSRSNDDSNDERKEVFGKRDNMPKSNFCSKCGAWKGQLGLEPTFDLYIKHLCNIFDEVKRVLRDDGTIWINLGDTYGGSGGASGHTEETKNLGYKTSQMGAVASGSKSASAKCLTMIPQRFAIEMVNRGWILRNTIIWHKRNCMPCSVKDRFTVDFEYIFFFSKKKKYYFETQYEEYAESTKEDHRFEKAKQEGITDLMGNKKVGYSGGKNIKDGYEISKSQNPIEVRNSVFNKGLQEGRNKRTVWTINPKPFKEAHFAVYPEELCETPIKSGCPEFVCVKCGKAKVLEIESEKIGGTPYYPQHKWQKEKGVGPRPRDYIAKKEIKGYKPTCNCNAGFTSGIVIDPFFGAGTTGLVALKQNKKFVGIELNPEYIEIAKKRLKPFLEQSKL